MKSYNDECKFKAPWGNISLVLFRASYFFICDSMPASPTRTAPKLTTKWKACYVSCSGDLNGRPVFLAHGRQDCAATFEPLMQFLPGKEFHYVAIDMPGSNTSDPLPIATTQCLCDPRTLPSHQTDSVLNLHPKFGIVDERFHHQQLMERIKNTKLTVKVHSKDCTIEHQIDSKMTDVSNQIVERPYDKKANNGIETKQNTSCRGIAYVVLPIEGNPSETSAIENKDLLENGNLDTNASHPHYIKSDTNLSFVAGMEASTSYEALPDKKHTAIERIIDPTVPLPLGRGFDIVNVVTGRWAKVLFYDEKAKGYWMLLMPSEPDDMNGRKRFRLAPTKQEEITYKEHPIYQDPFEDKNLAGESTGNLQNMPTNFEEPIRCNDHGERRCPFATRVPAFAVPPEGAVTPLPEYLAKTPIITKITPENVTEIQNNSLYSMMSQTYASEISMTLPYPRSSIPVTQAETTPEAPLTISVEKRTVPVIPRAQLRKMARFRLKIKMGNKHTQTDPPSTRGGHRCFSYTPWGVFPLCTHMPVGLMDWIHAFFIGQHNGFGYHNPDEYFQMFAQAHMPQFIQPPPPLRMMQPFQYQPPPPYNMAYPAMRPMPGSVPIYAMQPPTPRLYSHDHEYRESPPFPLISRPRPYVPDHPSAFAFNPKFLPNRSTPPLRRPHTTQPFSSLPNRNHDRAQFNRQEAARPASANNTFRPQVAAYVRRGSTLMAFTVNQVTYTDDGIPILPDWDEELGKRPRSPVASHQLCDIEPWLYNDGCRHKIVPGQGCPFDPAKRQSRQEQAASNTSSVQEFEHLPSLEAHIDEKIAFYTGVVEKCVKLMRFHFLAAMEMAIQHLGWDKFIFIGHSMGCELGLFFNALYPGRITKMILLDAEPTLRRLQVQDLVEYQTKFYDGYYNNYEKDNHFFRTYTIPQATEALMRSRNLSEKAATIVIKKSLIHVQGDQYRFTWDRRLKLPAPQNYPNTYYFALFKNVPPTLLISASQSLNANSRYSPGSLELIGMMTGLDNFKQVIVEGDHDVHLSHPERVAPYVKEFLTKNVVLPSKL